MKTILTSVRHILVILTLGSCALKADTFTNITIGGGTPSNNSLSAYGGTSSGVGSIALNYGYATGAGSFASSSIPSHSSTASGFSSLAMDGGSAQAEGSFAIGFDPASLNIISTVTSTGTCSFAISGGYVTAPYSVAMSGSQITAPHSLAFGNSSVSGTYSLAGSGGNSTAQYGFAFGNASYCVADNGAAFGFHTKSDAYECISVGAYNLRGTYNLTTWVATDPIFEVGNGTSSGFSNALTVLKNGNVTASGTITTSGTGCFMTTPASVSTTDVPMYSN